jgi:HPt (histidine-containing phosphotransfer) domain-containing protein
MNQKFNFNEILKATKESFDLADSVIFKLYRSTIKLASEVVDEIEQGVKDSNYEQIEDAAHKLKGATGSIRLDDIYKLSMEIENDAKIHEDRDYCKDLEVIKSFFLSLKNALKDAEKN